MNANEAREYLQLAVKTNTGKQVMRQLGLSVVIENPAGGDDKSSIAAAEMVAKQMRISYKI